MSSFLGQFANTVQQTGNAVSGVAETIYKLDAENIYKNKATEIGLGVEQFKDSLRTDTDFGIPDSEQPSGYMQKWKDYLDKTKSSLKTVSNPLARRQLEAYVGQLEVTKGAEISDLQFNGWGQQQVADAKKRISVVSKTGITTQAKLENANAEIQGLANNRLIDPNDVAPMLEAETQKILFDDAKKQVVTTLQTKGWGEAITLAANLAGATYTVGDTSVVLDPSALSSLTAIGNLLKSATNESKEQQLNTAFLNMKEGKLTENPIDLIRRINPEDVPGWVAKFENAQKTGEGAAGEQEYFAYDADIKAGKPFDRTAALASKNMNFSMKNALIQADAETKKDAVVFELGKAYDNLASLSLGKAIVDPSAPTLSSTYLNSLEGKIDPQTLATYRTQVWNLQSNIDTKAKTDATLNLTARILKGEVTKERVLAESPPEYLAQNFSLYLSMQAEAKRDGQDTSGMAVFSGIAQMQKKQAAGTLSQADLDDMGNLIEKNKDALGLSLYGSANSAYLSMYSVFTQSNSAMVAAVIKLDIAKNPDTYTIDGIFARKDITINDQVNLANYLGTLIPQNEADALTKEGLKLSDNLDRALKGLPVQGDVLSAAWLESHKNSLTPQVYAALQSSISKFEADAAVTATKDSLNNAVFSYRDAAYASGQPNATKREALYALIDKAMILAPEERAAFKDKLNTIDLNAEALAQSREDRVFQDNQRERTLGIQAKSDALEVAETAMQGKATDVLKDFSARISGLQGKDAESAYSQAVRDITAIYVSDPAKGQAFIHSADLLYTIQSNAEYSALDTRAKNAMDEYIKVQTVKGYVHDPSVEMMSEELIRTLFPTDSALDNKFGTYWKDKWNGFNASTAAMETAEAPALKILQDAKANSWAALNGVGFDPSAPVLNQTMLDQLTTLSSTHYRQFSDDLISIGSAIAAKQTADAKAKNGEGPTPAQKNAANSAYDIIGAVAESLAAQNLSRAAPTIIKYVDRDGKPVTAVATPERYNALLSDYAADLIAGGKFSDALALQQKFISKGNDPIWSDVTVTQKDMEKNGKWSPGMSAWLDGVKALYPSPSPEKTKEIITEMKTRSVNLNIGADWQLLNGNHDVSEIYLENAMAGKYAIYMTPRDGLYSATHPAFKDIQATFAAKSLEEINSVLRLSGKPELRDFITVNNPDGTVSYSVKTGNAKLNIGDTYYMGLYEGNALVMKESQGAAMVFVPWERVSGQKTFGRWASVVFDSAGNAMRSQGDKKLDIETNGLATTTVNDIPLGL